MQPKTFILIGRSGCGKGTQAKLLMDYIKSKDPSREIFYMETGARFREFIERQSFSGKNAKVINSVGGLQPEFLAVWMWSNMFVENLKGDENMVIDGTPRKLHEATVLDSAMDFYKREKPYVLYLNVSRKWSEARLMERHRADDLPADVKKRLDWFETDVLPTINYYRDNPKYNFLDINGEGTIEETFKDIIQKIKL